MIAFLKFVSRTFLIAILLISKGVPAFSQKEYLVTVDPSSGNYTKMDSIPGVMYILLFDLTTIDQSNHHFIFIGGPTQTNFNLVTLNSLNGKIISNPSFPNYSGLIGLTYSKSTDALYGLIINSGIYSLVTFNTQTGNYSTIKSFSNIEGINEFSLDDNDQHIILNGTDNGNAVLATFDILTGNMIAEIPSEISNMVYDNLSNKLYGIIITVGQGNTGVFTFGTENTNTGAFTAIGNLPSDITGITQGNVTFDENDHLYIFTASDNSGDSYLYSIDANSGNVVYKAPVSLTNDINEDNLIQFRYDNSLGKLYALHWEAKTITQSDSSCNLKVQTKLYPNPFGNFLIVNKNPTICKVRMNLYTAIGQLLITGRVINDGENKIMLSNLANGVYFYEFYSNNKILLTGKIVKQN